MSAVRNVQRQFVQRRLWPVAILMIAALAAVPLMLASEPETVPPAPVPVADQGEDVLASQPIVTPVSAADGATRRKVLGTAKNPFGFTEEDTGSGAAANSATANVANDPATSSGDGDVTTGGDVTAGGGSTPTPTAVEPVTPADPAPPRKTYSRYELTVRFGSSSEQPSRMSLKRLQPLPKAELPAVIYLGVSKDGKSAIFLLEKGVQAVGDGDCHPTPEECETVRLAAGETEFFDVVDETGTVSAQYQLDLVKIHRAETASASKATASSKAGRRLLEDRVSGSGRLPFRFDADSGTLERRAPATGEATRSVATNVAAGTGALR